MYLTQECLWIILPPAICTPVLFNMVSPGLLHHLPLFYYFHHLMVLLSVAK